MILIPLSTADYIRNVLPQTHELWGAPREFERYAADFRETAKLLRAGRRRFTVGIEVDDRVVVSCKLYDRQLRWRDGILRATGVGAVFTLPEYRGRGYASAMLGMILDRERAAGCDVAFLFSDIHPAFYERLGFVRLPSRLFTLPAKRLDGSRAGGAPLETTDWPALLRCFNATDRERVWSFKRTPTIWGWTRRRWEAPARESEQSVRLVIRRGREIAAYVVGRRVLRDDAFWVDEFGFAGKLGHDRISALLRAAAGDLRRVTGWLPPPVARDALPRVSVRDRKNAVFMIAPLSNAGRAWWRVNRGMALSSRADPIWIADHV